MANFMKLFGQYWGYELSPNITSLVKEVMIPEEQKEEFPFLNQDFSYSEC